MESPSWTKFFTLLLASACIRAAGALDIAFDSITCDETLPAYTSMGDVQMTCNESKSTRCSFGEEVNLRGTLQYYGLNETAPNGTGYASANLRLLSVEYNLFKEFPIDFCGSWVEPVNETEDGMYCPDLDGSYYFNIDYKLPFDDDDITTWFATGWSGESVLQVKNGYSDDSDMLADCTLHWHTYVTPSSADGWKTMPSAAQTGIVLASIFTAILCCCTYMTCCRRRKKHVTDVSYYNDFADYEIYDEKKQKKRNKRKSKNRKSESEATLQIDSVEASRL